MSHICHITFFVKQETIKAMFALVLRTVLTSEIRKRGQGECGNHRLHWIWQESDNVECIIRLVQPYWPTVGHEIRLPPEETNPLGIHDIRVDDHRDSGVKDHIAVRAHPPLHHIQSYKMAHWKAQGKTFLFCRPCNGLNKVACPQPCLHLFEARFKPNQSSPVETDHFRILLSYRNHSDQLVPITPVSGGHLQ